MVSIDFRNQCHSNEIYKLQSLFDSLVCVKYVFVFNFEIGLTWGEAGSSGNALTLGIVLAVACCRLPISQFHQFEFPRCKNY